MSKRDDITLFDEDDFNIDDLDDILLESFPEEEPKNQSSKSRKVVEEIKDLAKDSFDQTLLTERYNISDTIRDALPPEYSDAFNLKDDVGRSLRDVVTETSRELKRNTSAFKRLSFVLGETAEGKLPRFVTDKLKEVGKSVDDVRSVLSEKEIEEQIILKQIADVFQQQNSIQNYLVKEEKRKEREEGKRNQFNQQLQHKRHSETLYYLDRISKATIALADYNSLINLQVQRKSLEHVIRQTNILTGIHTEVSRMRREQFEITTAIMKNTALPEYVKIQNSEAMKMIMRERFWTGALDTIFKENHYVANLIREGKRGLTGWISGLINKAGQAASMASDQIESTSSMSRQASEMGMDNGRLGTAGSVIVGSGIATGIGKLIGKGKVKINRYLDGSDSILGHRLSHEQVKRIREYGNSLSSRIAGLEETMDGVIDRANSSEPKGWLERGASGIVRGITDVHMRAKDQTRYRVGSVATRDDLKSSAVFTEQVSRSITRVIPGYLARILRSIDTLRSGREASLTVYDWRNDSFPDANSLKKRILSTVYSKELSDAFRDRSNSNFQTVFGQITDTSKFSLRDKIAFTRMLDENQGKRLYRDFFSEERLGKYFNPRSTKRISRLMDHYYSDNTVSHSRESNLRKNYTQAYGKIDGSALSEYADLGLMDVIHDLKLAGADGYLDTNYLKAMIRGEVDIDGLVGNPSHVKRMHRGLKGKKRGNRDNRDGNVGTSGGNHPLPDPRPSGGGSAASSQTSAKDSAVTEYSSPDITSSIDNSKLLVQIRDILQSTQQTLASTSKVTNRVVKPSLLRRLSSKETGKSSDHDLIDNSNVKSVGLSRLIKGLGYLPLLPAITTMKVSYGMAKYLSKMVFGSKKKNTQLNRTKTTVADIYVGNEHSPRLIAMLIKEGLYVDRNTGKIITSIKDIKGDIVRKDNGEVVLKESEIKESYIRDQRRTITLLSAVGSVASLATLPTRMAVAATLKTTKLMYGATKTTTGLLVKTLGRRYLLTVPADVYVMEHSGLSLRLTASKMREGVYVDVKTRKIVKAPRDITGMVMDSSTQEMALSHDDYLRGLYDNLGRLIIKRKGTLSRSVSAVVGTALLPFKVSGFVAKKSLGTTAKFAKGIFKASAKTALYFPKEFIKSISSYQPNTEEIIKDYKEKEEDHGEGLLKNKLHKTRAKLVEVMRKLRTTSLSTKEHNKLIARKNRLMAEVRSLSEQLGITLDTFLKGSRDSIKNKFSKSISSFRRLKGRRSAEESKEPNVLDGKAIGLGLKGVGKSIKGLGEDVVQAVVRTHADSEGVIIKSAEMITSSIEDTSTNSIDESKSVSRQIRDYLKDTSITLNTNLHSSFKEVMEDHTESMRPQLTALSRIGESIDFGNEILLKRFSDESYLSPELKLARSSASILRQIRDVLGGVTHTNLSYIKDLLGLQIVLSNPGLNLKLKRHLLTTSRPIVFNDNRGDNDNSAVRVNNASINPMVSLITRMEDMNRRRLNEQQRAEEEAHNARLDRKWFRRAKKSIFGPFRNTSEAISWRLNYITAEGEERKRMEREREILKERKARDKERVRNDRSRRTGQAQGTRGGILGKIGSFFGDGLGWTGGKLLKYLGIAGLGAGALYGGAGLLGLDDLQEKILDVTGSAAKYLGGLVVQGMWRMFEGITEVAVSSIPSIMTGLYNNTIGRLTGRLGDDGGKIQYDRSSPLKRMLGYKTEEDVLHEQRQITEAGSLGTTGYLAAGTAALASASYAGKNLPGFKKNPNTTYNALKSSGSKAAGVSKYVRSAGRLSVFAGGAVLANDLYQGDHRSASGSGGALLGGLAGSAKGAAMGSVVGPWGIAIGGIVGGVLGAIIGSDVGTAIYDTVTGVVKGDLHRLRIFCYGFTNAATKTAWWFSDRRSFIKKLNELESVANGIYKFNKEGEATNVNEKSHEKLVAYATEIFGLSKDSREDMRSLSAFLTRFIAGYTLFAQQVLRYNKGSLADLDDLSDPDKQKTLGELREKINQTQMVDIFNAYIGEVFVGETINARHTDILKYLDSLRKYGIEEYIKANEPYIKDLSKSEQTERYVKERLTQLGYDYMNTGSAVTRINGTKIKTGISASRTDNYYNEKLLDPTASNGKAMLSLDVIRLKMYGLSATKSGTMYHHEDVADLIKLEEYFNTTGNISIDAKGNISEIKFTKDDYVILNAITRRIDFVRNDINKESHVREAINWLKQRFLVVYLHYRDILKSLGKESIKKCKTYNFTVEENYVIANKLVERMSRLKNEIDSTSITSVYSSFMGNSNNIPETKSIWDVRFSPWRGQKMEVNTDPASIDKNIKYLTDMYNAVGQRYLTEEQASGTRVGEQEQKEALRMMAETGTVNKSMVSKFKKGKLEHLQKVVAPLLQNAKVKEQYAKVLDDFAKGSEYTSLKLETEVNGSSYPLEYRIYPSGRVTIYSKNNNSLTDVGVFNDDGSFTALSAEGNYISNNHSGVIETVGSLFIRKITTNEDKEVMTIANAVSGHIHDEKLRLKEDRYDYKYKSKDGKEHSVDTDVFKHKDHVRNTAKHFSMNNGSRKGIYYDQSTGQLRNSLSFKSVSEASKHPQNQMAIKAIDNKHVYRFSQNKLIKHEDYLGQSRSNTDVKGRLKRVGDGLFAYPILDDDNNVRDTKFFSLRNGALIELGGSTSNELVFSSEEQYKAFMASSLIAPGGLIIHGNSVYRLESRKGEDGGYHAIAVKEDVIDTDTFLAYSRFLEESGNLSEEYNKVTYDGDGSIKTMVDSGIDVGRTNAEKMHEQQTNNIHRQLGLGDATLFQKVRDNIKSKSGVLIKNDIPNAAESLSLYVSNKYPTDKDKNSKDTQNLISKTKHQHHKAVDWLRNASEDTVNVISKTTDQAVDKVIEYHDKYTPVAKQKLETTIRGVNETIGSVADSATEIYDKGKDKVLHLYDNTKTKVVELYNDTTLKTNTKRVIQDSESSLARYQDRDTPDWMYDKFKDISDIWEEGLEEAGKVTDAVMSRMKKFHQDVTVLMKYWMEEIKTAMLKAKNKKEALSVFNKNFTSKDSSDTYNKIVNQISNIKSYLRDKKIDLDGAVVSFVDNITTAIMGSYRNSISWVDKMLYRLCDKLQTMLAEGTLLYGELIERVRTASIKYGRVPTTHINTVRWWHVVITGEVPDENRYNFEDFKTRLNIYSSRKELNEFVEWLELGVMDGDSVGFLDAIAGTVGTFMEDPGHYTKEGLRNVGEATIAIIGGQQAHAADYQDNRRDKQYTFKNGVALDSSQFKEDNASKLREAMYAHNTPEMTNNVDGLISKTSKVGTDNKVTSPAILPPTQATSAGSEAFADANAPTEVAGTTKSGIKLVWVYAMRAGKRAKVNILYAKAFQGFLNDFEATGYQIRQLHGYSHRGMYSTKLGGYDNSRLSYHAFGAAIDINPDRNYMRSRKQTGGKTITDMPANTGEIAKKWGLGWGGLWKNSTDAMHFSVAKSEGGTVAIRRDQDPSTCPPMKAKFNTDGIIDQSLNHKPVEIPQAKENSSSVGIDPIKHDAMQSTTPGTLEPNVVQSLTGSITNSGNVMDVFRDNPGDTTNTSINTDSTDSGSDYTQTGIDSKKDNTGSILVQNNTSSKEHTAKKASKDVVLSSKDVKDIIKVASTEVILFKTEKIFQQQCAAVIDTILNRVASGHWGRSVQSVVNAKHQFSKIAGPKSLKPYGTVDNMPDSDIRERVDRFGRAYIRKRAEGMPSIVGDHLNYANPHHSTSNNLGWINKLKSTGLIFGSGKAVHYHGTVDYLQKHRPGQYRVILKDGNVGTDDQNKESKGNNGVILDNVNGETGQYGKNVTEGHTTAFSDSEVTQTSSQATGNAYHGGTVVPNSVSLANASSTDKSSAIVGSGTEGNSDVSDSISNGGMVPVSSQHTDRFDVSRTSASNDISGISTSNSINDTIDTHASRINTVIPTNGSVDMNVPMVNVNTLSDPVIQELLNRLVQAVSQSNVHLTDIVSSVKEGTEVQKNSIASVINNNNTSATVTPMNEREREHMRGRDASHFSQPPKQLPLQALAMDRDMGKGNYRHI